MVAAVTRLPEGLPTGLLVIKVGSSLLIEADGTVRREWVSSLVADLAGLIEQGRRAIIVSSGSIALGARRLGFDKGGRASLADAQAAASVGQIALSSLWSELLAEHGLTAAQILLTLGDLEDRRRYLNVTATLGRLLEKGAVPVINENDSVATEEIRFGDNDRLAARVAQASKADHVLLLSDIDGLYDRNPADPAAQFIDRVEAITPDITAMADGGSASGMGSGGMASKIDAARIANLAGIGLTIISGQPAHPIARYIETGRGTVFQPQRQERARKSWLGGRLTSSGSITIDAGAVRALGRGSSLLAAGITAIVGEFSRSDVVDVVGPDDRLIARGLSEYDASDLHKIMGRRSADHGALLGYAPRSAAVHRDQMVMV
jgi:glutamate 5-kinase